MNIIYRGTTPIFEIPLNFDTKLIEKIYITFMQKDEVVLEKDITACQLQSDTINVLLTQEETLSLKCTCLIAVQARAKLTDGTVLVSPIEYFTVNDVIKGGVI